MGVFFGTQRHKLSSRAGRRHGRTGRPPREPSKPHLEALEERTLLSPYSDAVLADFPSGYWRLGEAKGTTASDSSGLERHGTYVGGVFLGLPGAIVGDPDTSAFFDGAKSFVQVAGKPFNFSANFSLEAWVINPGQIDPNPVGRIISNGQPGSRGYGWGLLRDNRIRFTTYGILDYDSDVIIPTDDFYHHVVVTFDDSFTAHIYLDGTLAQSLPGPRAANSSDLDFAIGRNPPGTSPPENWFGIIDEVAVYEYVLSEEQVFLHYVLGVSGGLGAGRGSGSVLPPAISPDHVHALSIDPGYSSAVSWAGSLTQSPVADQAMAAADLLFASLPAEDSRLLPALVESGEHQPEELWDRSLTEELPLAI
jgi:Concanavalin A-like lectin/glucanases superfamily